MNTLYQTSWRALQVNASSSPSSWTCASCRRALARLRSSQPPRRTVSNSSAKKQQAPPAANAAAAAPSMERMREYYKYKNRTTICAEGETSGLNGCPRFYTLSVILGTVAFSYGSVPMYKMICQTTGWGGQPVRSPSHGGSGSSDSADFDPASRLTPVADARRIRVTFNASVSDVLPWKFVPQQREVRVLPGETALAFYKATNRSDSDIIGVATYSVTPAQVAPYFSKIQCFCFEEQRLNAGETVDMPVFFYLDPDMLNDLNMRGVNEVTLSYTFFKAKYDNNGNFKMLPTA
ncbi:Cytochrome c oxidase assembly protein cox11, mitochondrial [Parahypoxylon ruwenzoriense]